MRTREEEQKCKEILSNELEQLMKHIDNFIDLLQLDNNEVITHEQFIDFLQMVNDRLNLNYLI